MAAILLAGAVAGAAAFAHLLGSVPAPSPFAGGQLPPAPHGPLVVEAAPWSPNQAAPRHIATLRPSGRYALTPASHRATRPIVHKPVQAPVRHTTPVTAPRAPIAKQAQVAPDPLVAAKPQPAAPAPAAAPAPVAAPAPLPTLAERALTQTAPAVVVTAVTATSAITSNDAKHQSGSDRRRGYRSHDDGDNGNNNNNGNGSSSDKATKGLTLLDNVPVTVTAPTPAPTPSPAPVVALRPPSIDPPSTGSWPSGDHGNGSHAGWQGDAGSDRSH